MAAQATVSSSGQVQVSPSTGAADTAAIALQLAYQDVQLPASSAAAANGSGGDGSGSWMVSVQNGAAGRPDAPVSAQVTPLPCARRECFDTKDLPHALQF